MFLRWQLHLHSESAPQVSEAILDNARLMLQTENVQANAEDFKDRCVFLSGWKNTIINPFLILFRTLADAGDTIKCAGRE